MHASPPTTKVKQIGHFLPNLSKTGMLTATAGNSTPPEKKKKKIVEYP